MSRVASMAVSAVTPDSASVLRAMGVPEGREPGARVAGVLEDAVHEFATLAEPRGIVSDIDRDEFAAVYAGEGDNESPAPLELVLPRAERLTLFVVTLGETLSARIPRLFDEGEPALAATLDAAASLGTEFAAERMERLIEADLLTAGEVSPGSRSLRYSPGYCGWSMTGQRALFEALGPEKVGVRLLESCLMEPLKSISGVIVTGPADIHIFDDDFQFCSLCATRECRDRIHAVTASTERQTGP